MNSAFVGYEELSRSSIEPEVEVLTATYNNHVFKPQPILNAVVRQGVIRLGRG